jgi:hypothetical protein
MVSFQLLNVNGQSTINSYIRFQNTSVNAPGLAFVSRVSLSALGVLDHLHVLQLRFSSSLLGFRHERVVTVREFYTKCNAGFRWSEELFNPTLVVHIHLDKNLITNSFSLRLLWTKVYLYYKERR